MNEYTIIKTSGEGYGRLILCLSFESLLTYINNIEHVLVQDGVNEKVLIDQLLITGDGANRFMSSDFTQGKLDFRTAQIVQPAEYFRRKTNEWLHDNYSLVENSILTEQQRQKIKDKIVFQNGKVPYHWIRFGGGGLFLFSMAQFTRLRTVTFCIL